jgi:hypothetical protein
MAYIQISNIDGTPPFQFYVCDYGGIGTTVGAATQTLTLKFY